MRYPRFAGTPARSNALVFPVLPSEINQVEHGIPSLELESLMRPVAGIVWKENGG